MIETLQFLSDVADIADTMLLVFQFGYILRSLYFA